MTTTARATGLYPLFADLAGLPVLVVGGGSVAERKAAALLDAGARVRVGAPWLNPALTQWAAAGRIEHLAGEFQPAWLDEVWLVIAATDDRAINAEVAARAGERRILANVVDDPALSRFQVPAVIDRAPLTIAISTAGAAPVLARRLREQLEAQLDHALGPLVALAQRHRPAIARRLPDLAARRRFYDWLHDGPVMALMRSAQPEQAEQALLEALRQPQPASTPTGSVVLVGAGPGAPGLLTLQALRALNEADVILHDQLVSAEILALARRDAERIDVDMRGDGKHTPQEHVHQLLLQHAQAGRRAVRLTDGDPFVFGRGGEEMAFLRQHGIACAVVPGITAAVACAAYAGIPLTHREHAQSVRLLTAHCKESLDSMDWAALAQERQTLAIDIRVALLDVLTAGLLHGLHPDTPFALIENGTRPRQRVLCGVLQQLPALARQHAIHAPAMLVVGAVAALADAHAWFGELLHDRGAP